MTTQFGFTKAVEAEAEMRKRLLELEEEKKHTQEIADRLAAEHKRFQELMRKGFHVQVAELDALRADCVNFCKKLGTFADADELFAWVIAQKEKTLDGATIIN